MGRLRESVRRRRRGPHAPDGHRHRRRRRRQVPPDPRVPGVRRRTTPTSSAGAACRTAGASRSGRSSRSSAARPASTRTIRPIARGPSSSGSSATPRWPTGSPRRPACQRRPYPAWPSCSGPSSGWWRSSPSADRSCSSSTTSTGPSRRCSTCSSTSPTASLAGPVLILCTARHDLLEERPSWADGARRAGSSSVRSTPSDAGAMVEACSAGRGIPPAVLERVTRAAEGNPLFVEQLVSMLVDEGTLRRVEGDWRLADEVGEIPVPPTIQALLAARLDRLGREERAVIEPASVIGLVFQESAVRWLAPEAVQAGRCRSTSSALDRKQLVHPTAPEPTTTRRYRFHHILIRDAAYNGQLKRARAGAPRAVRRVGRRPATPTATGRSSSRRSSATTSSRPTATWPSSVRSTSTGSSSACGPPSAWRRPVVEPSPGATCRRPPTCSAAPRRTCPAGDPAPRRRCSSRPARRSPRPAS